MDVTLVYDINVGIQPASVGAPLYNKAANLDFDPNGETAALIGMTLTGNSTSNPGVGIIRRTLTYTLDPQGLSAFPTVELVKKATRNLFGRIFAAKLAAFVTAGEPVVT